MHYLCHKNRRFRYADGVGVGKWGDVMHRLCDPIAESWAFLPWSLK